MLTAMASPIGLRGATVVRVVATILVVLAVSPLTQPFATCDLADLNVETSRHGALSSPKTAKDGSTLLVVVVESKPLMFDGPPLVSLPADRELRGPALPLVLRL